MIRILIIDEDTDVLRLLRVKLTAEGYEVFQARDGKEALDIAEKDAPEVVVMEQVLPDMEGHVLLTQLKELLSPETLVLILSSERGDEDIERAFSAGASDYITKPFSPRVLLERLRVNMIRAQSGVGDSREV